MLLKSLSDQKRSDDEARAVHERLARERVAARRNSAKDRRVEEEMSFPDSNDILLLRVSE